MRKQIFLLLAITLLSLPLLWAQEQTPQRPQGDMAGMDMSSHGASAANSPDAHDMPGMSNDGSANAMQAMESHHMDMGPHMKMTSLREPKPGDRQKAVQVVEAARTVAEKYTDYKVALADGFEIFMPNRPQKQYHFTNYAYAFEARQHFNPDHPTSLLYEKDGSGYKLIGVMYTAAKYASEDELESRVPLSIAQWHAHVNLCLPPGFKRGEGLPRGSEFGLHGSIATKEACDAAGGRFIPQIFGWMVHVYPFEQKPENIWSVERQAHHDD
jgi:hypothetical protein